MIADLLVPSSCLSSFPPNPSSAPAPNCPPLSFSLPLEAWRAGSVFTYSGPSLSLSNRVGRPLPGDSSLGSCHIDYLIHTHKRGESPRSAPAGPRALVSELDLGIQIACTLRGTAPALEAQSRREVVDAGFKSKCGRMSPLKLAVSQFRPKLIVIATKMMMKKLTAIICQTLALNAPGPSLVPDGFGPSPLGAGQGSAAVRSLEGRRI